MGNNGLDLKRAGYAVVDGFLSEADCQSLLAEISAFRGTHSLPEIHRPTKGRELRYHVIDGEQIRADLPGIWNIYTGKANEWVNGAMADALVPLDNVRAGVNVNLMQPGQSSYRWHYDRCRVTSILYLNQVEGGQTELYPNYRIRLGNGGAQRLLDRLIRPPLIRDTFGEMVQVEPRVGRLVAMRGDRCYHSVRAVSGDRERINIVLSYDRPEATFPMEAGLDSYLYTQEKQRSSDPNYR